MDDIKVLRLECATCRGSISVPIERLLRVPNECPACGAVLRDRFKPDLAIHLEELAGLLRTIAGGLADTKHPDPVRLRLEFDAGGS